MLGVELDNTPKADRDLWYVRKKTTQTFFEKDEVRPFVFRRKATAEDQTPHAHDRGMLSLVREDGLFVSPCTMRLDGSRLCCFLHVVRSVQHTQGKELSVWRPV